MSYTKEFKEKEEDFIYLKIRKEDSCAFLSYSSFIQNHLEQKNHIPVRVFEKFIFLKRKSILNQKEMMYLISQKTD